eukprot:7383580-Prymnesium_polylepis.1
MNQAYAQGWRCHSQAMLPTQPPMVRLALGVTCTLAAGWSAPAGCPPAVPAIGESSACNACQYLAWPAGQRAQR